MQWSRIVALTSFVVLWDLSSALACSCVFQTAEQQLLQSDRVFAGVVLSVEILDGDFGPVHRSVVQVREVWKGDTEGRLIVDTTPISTCDLSLQLGQNYLIYAEENPREAGAYRTNECQRTRLRANADEDFIKLGTPIYVLAGKASSWATVKALY